MSLDRHVGQMRNSAAERTLELPAGTIVKLGATLALIWLWLQLWQFVLLLLVAVVLAVALDPAVRWLEGHGIPRGFGAAAVVLGILAVFIGFAVLAGSSLVSQSRLVGTRLDQVQQEIFRRAPALLRLLPAGDRTADIMSVAPYVAGAGRTLAVAGLELLVAFVLTLYLVADGRRTYAWVLAYVPKRKRARAHATACQARRAILAYIAGNVATSLFAMAFVLTALWLLRVPAALLLALLAGVCDFVPVLGFIASGVPAVLLALSRSAMTGLAVAGLFLVYHGIENYVIAPRVYGNRLRLSNLAVLVAFAVGAEIGGIVGAVLALPVAAMYPVIERLWLRRYLGAEVVDTHMEIEKGRGETAGSIPA